MILTLPFTGRVRTLIRERCSYCSGEALFYTYPWGPHLPVPVCGACRNR